jgi:hypothetical protein
MLPQQIFVLKLGRKGERFREIDRGYAHIEDQWSESLGSRCTILEASADCIIQNLPEWLPPPPRFAAQQFLDVGIESDGGSHRSNHPKGAVPMLHARTSSIKSCAAVAWRGHVRESRAARGAA